MKRSVRTLLAGVASIGLAVLPAMTAQAAATQTVTITQAWGYQYETLINPAGTLQAVIDYGDGAVYFVDLSTNAVTQVTDANSTFSDPYRAAFSPDGTQLYVSNYGDAWLSIVDVVTATVTGTFTTPNSENTAIGFSPDGDLLVVTDDYDNAYLYDLSNSGTQIGTTQGLDNEVIGVFFTSATSALLVDEYGYLYTMNLTDGTLSSSFGDGTADSYGVCASSDLSTLYMPNYNDGDSVQVVDVATGDITSIDVTSVVTSSSLALCSVSKDDSKVFITDWDNDDLKPVVVVVDATTKTAKNTIDITGLAADDPTDPSYPNGLTDGINVLSDCTFIVNGYYGNAAIVDFCEPTLPNTGVDTVAMSVAAVGGMALVAVGAFAVVLVRRRATR